MAEASSSSKRLIIIVVLLIFLIVGVAAGAIWYLTQEAANTSEQPQQTTKEKMQTEDNLAQIGPLYPLEPITVNLKTPDEKDVYLKITLSLELNNKLLANELDAKNAIIRDKIILILSSKTADALSSSMGKSQLCDTIKNSLNAILTDGQIRHVYIVDFIIQ